MPDMIRAVTRAAGNDPASLILAAEDGTVYVASPERHAVLAVDTATRAVRAVAPGFQRPGGLAVLHDATLGDRLFAADTLAGTVRVLDATDLRTLAETAVGPGPYALAAVPEASHVFVALSGGDVVVMLDASGALLTTTHLGGLGFPQGLAVDPRDGRVYVSYTLSPRYGQIAALDGATGAVVGIIPPTLDRPLAGAARLTITRAGDDPAGHRLLVATDRGVLTYDLDAGMWEDVIVGDRATPFPEALGETQMRQLKRYTGNITLALDPDAAGDHATLRGLEAARQSLEREWEPVISPTGLVRQESRLKAQLRIAALPDGLDPDELAYQDVDRWRQVIAQARPIVDYYLAIVGREEDLSTGHGKAKAVERMAPLIAEIANPVERGHYIQTLARLVQADERLIAAQVATLGRGADLARQDAKSAAKPHSPRPGETPAQGGAAGASPGAARRPGGEFAGSTHRTPSSGLEEYILGWLLLRPELLASLDAEMIGQQTPPLGPEDFASAESRALLAELQVTPAPGEDLSPEDRLAELPSPLAEHARSLVADVLGKPPLPDEKLTKDLVDSLLRLRERNLGAQIQNVKSLIQESERAGAPDDREGARQLHELMTVYSAQKRHIHKLLDVRSFSGALAKTKAERKV